MKFTIHAAGLVITFIIIGVLFGTYWGALIALTSYLAGLGVEKAITKWL